jgi:predicted transglutaminase-like cysteine proteinase
MGISGIAGAFARMGAVALFVASAAGTAFAGPMATGGYTSQPIGHYDFCKLNPRECSLTPIDRGPLRMSKAIWTMISDVNASVNRSIRPVSDFDQHGKDEVWSYPEAGIGDCEDYVLEKRRELKRRGVSLSNLLITVVRKRDGEGHAILTVRTDKGDFVLDNLNNDIKPWRETGYQFLKRQANHHTGRWVSLRDDQNMLVGSVTPR